MCSAKSLNRPIHSATLHMYVTDLLLLQTSFIAEGWRPRMMTTPVHATAAFRAVSRVLTHSAADNSVQSLMSSIQRLVGLPRPLTPPTRP